MLTIIVSVCLEPKKKLEIKNQFKTTPKIEGNIPLKHVDLFSTSTYLI